MKLIGKGLHFIAIMMLVGIYGSAQELVHQARIESGLDGFFKSGNNGKVIISSAGVESKGGGAGITLWSGADKRQTSVSVLKDFPEAERIHIWDTGVLPSGGFVVAGILEEPRTQGQRVKARSVVLSYDAAGGLKEVWDVSPYTFHTITADKDGNVFGFGERADKPESARVSMVVKYSPQGALLGEFLPRSLFLKTQDPAETSAAVGSSRLQVGPDGSIVLYVAGTHELISIPPYGGAIKRFRLDRALQARAEFRGKEWIHMLSLLIEKDGSIVAHVVASDKHGTASRLVVVDRELSGIKALSTGLSVGQLLGVDEGGNFIFHHASDAKTHAIERYKRASIIGNIPY